jgi:LacI family transcriptional regulator
MEMILSPEFHAQDRSPVVEPGGSFSPAEGVARYREAGGSNALDLGSRPFRGQVTGGVSFKSASTLGIPAVSIKPAKSREATRTNPVRTSAAKPHRLRVALLIETSRSYGRDLLVGIAQYVREHGPWSIEFQEGDPCEEPPEWFKRWKGDGVIARVKTPSMAKAIAKLQVPAVDLYCGLPRLAMASIRSDEALVGRLAAQHLLERGFRQFAFCGFNGTDWSDRRRAGFQQCIAEACFPCQVFENPQLPNRLATVEYEEHGAIYERQLSRWLQALPKPIGLMACNDVRGRQVLNACRDLELLVPDDIAVIGVDKDEVLCELCDVPLSSVILNTKRIGYEAAALVARIMAGEKPPSETIFVAPMGVATRRSTDVLSVQDPNLAKALLYIRDHACGDINVDEVATFAGLSRTVIQRRFRKVLHETVHEAIIGFRLKRACELLSGTDLPQIDIAERAGFKHCEYMGAVFKAIFGKTPAQYRNQFMPVGVSRIP